MESPDRNVLQGDRLKKILSFFLPDSFIIFNLSCTFMFHINIVHVHGYSKRLSPFGVDKSRGLLA